MSADTPPGDSNGRPLRADDLQLSPPPPAPTAPEPLPDGVSQEALERVRRPPAVTKLRILLRCHEAAARARQARELKRQGRAAALLLLGFFLGALAGLGVFAAVYDNPEQYAQRYFDPAAGAYTYFIKGETVTQQRYDYFLATGSNYTSAISAALMVGLAVVAVFALSLWLRGRRPTPEPAGVMDEQIAAIVRDHPDAVREWGGPSVLRERCLVAEVLRIEEKNSR